jgi:hypothetical protein
MSPSRPEPLGLGAALLIAESGAMVPAASLAAGAMVESVAAGAVAAASAPDLAAAEESVAVASCFLQAETAKAAAAAMPAMTSRREVLCIIQSLV